MEMGSSNTNDNGNTSVKQTEKGEKKLGAVMIPLFDIPFAPAYDDLYPVKDEKDKGVLCVYFNPYKGGHTVRMQRDLSDIMDTIGIYTRYVDKINFYQLGNKMIITHGIQNQAFENALTYNGETFDLESPALICNKGFTSLTQAEALKMLESIRLRRGIKNKLYFMNMVIEE